MAEPRIFVSSTYYDLKYVRDSLDRFIRSHAYIPVLFENSSVPYLPDHALDESCYSEIQNCDIFVMIIGGRYGSLTSDHMPSAGPSFFERYDSITRREYRTALERGMPLYVLIERDVYSEYSTYQNNRGNQSVKYAHVDSVNVFHLIEEVTESGKPIRTFVEYSEIEEWLGLQWAGLFRFLINSKYLPPHLTDKQETDSRAAELTSAVTGLRELEGSSLSPEEAANIASSVEAERPKPEK